MDPRHILPRGLAEDASTDTHARRCRALAQLVAEGHLLSLRRAGGDHDDDDDADADASSSSPSRDLAVLIDLDALAFCARLLQRDSGFPPGNTLHTFAVKANPCEGVLKAFRDLGFGAEVASLGELEAALAAGFRASDIVFDSPCKTRAELKRALTAGVRVNLDSLAEVSRVAALLEGTTWGRALMLRWRDEQQQQAATPPPGGGSSSSPKPNNSSPPLPVIGVRVNPQVGSGAIAALSTSTDDSKFGVPLLGGGDDRRSERAQLGAAFRQHSWLRALHLHVGSQGVPLEAVAEGAARAWQFVREELPEGGLVAFDIGGGTPVDFASDGEAARRPPFGELARLVRERVPELWGPGEEEQGGPPPPLLITENGRALVAKAGCVVARVEYVKHGDEEEEEEEKEEAEGAAAAAAAPAAAAPAQRRPIAVCHAGADLLMRACYLPSQWSLRLFVVDGATFAPREREALKAAPMLLQDVAGPLCFQGDRLAVSRPLPRIRGGDWVVVADAGAYCMSMWSHYNSRQSPSVWGYRGGAGVGGRGGGGGGAPPSSSSPPPPPPPLRLELLRQGDTLSDVLRFWAAVGR
jgi:diaminopimelate decarboxylase